MRIYSGVVDESMGICHALHVYREAIAWNKLSRNPVPKYRLSLSLLARGEAWGILSAWRLAWAVIRSVIIVMVVLVMSFMVWLIVVWRCILHGFAIFFDGFFIMLAGFLAGFLTMMARRRWRATIITGWNNGISGESAWYVDVYAWGACSKRKIGLSAGNTGYQASGK